MRDLVLLHGALGSAKQFTKLEEELSGHFNTYRFNFEGHGGRNSNRAFSIQAFSENLTEFLIHKKLEIVYIFGYSMGGYVALYTTANHPHLIHKIATLGTKFDWNQASSEREVKMLDPEKIEEKVPQFAQQLKSLHGIENWREVLNQTASMMLSMGNNAPLNKTILKRIQQEIVIGVGDKDQMVSQEESSYVANTLVNSKISILENVPHPIEKIPINVLSEYILSSLN